MKFLYSLARFIIIDQYCFFCELLVNSHFQCVKNMLRISTVSLKLCSQKGDKKETKIEH